MQIGVTCDQEFMEVFAYWHTKGEVDSPLNETLLTGGHFLGLHLGSSFSRYWL
jgi:hypothetical protein